MGQDGNVNGQGIRAAAGNNLLSHLTGIGFIHTPEDQPVALGTEGFLQAGNDFEHMGILKSPVGGEVCQHGHLLCGAPGKALGAGAWVIVQFPDNVPNPSSGFLGDAVMAVDDLGNRGDGSPRSLRHVLDGYAHG